MRNKGAIKFLAIALAIVCLYQLSFTWVTSIVRGNAEESASVYLAKEKIAFEKLSRDNKAELVLSREDNAKVLTLDEGRKPAYIDSLIEVRKRDYFDNVYQKGYSSFVDSISSEGVYNFVWIKDFTYKECQERELNLGLDLKGGMNVTLEISVVEIIRSLSNYSIDSTFSKSIKLAQELQKNSQDDFVTLFGRAFEQLQPNGKLSAIFNTIELKSKINFNSTNAEVLDVIRKETEGAIDNSFNILRSRIDKFGVTQPNIQRLQTSGRVLVELPGIKEPERVRKLLQGTANLEFWETFDNREVFNFIQSANNKLKEIEELRRSQQDTTVKADSTKKDVALADKMNEETKKDTLKKDSSLVDKMKKDTSKANNQSIEEFTKNNPLFALLRPMVSNDGQLMQGAAVGMCHFKDTAKVTHYLNTRAVKEILPRNAKFLWEVKAYDSKVKGSWFRLIAIKISQKDGKPALGGEVITNAREEFGDNQATAEVTMTMNGEGAKTWARLTKENIGKQIAIVLDGSVYSYPTVQNEIKGGNSQITGDFSISEAKDLANILKSGKMPAPARIIQEEVVGPSLGKEAINKSLISFIIAFAIVLIYMILFYHGAGVAANIALVANVFFIFGILASLNAVLTLPGIAGIVITLGMAVDANVLIFERILEELRAGKGLGLAIKDGFHGAYSAIIDSQVTTILTGIILFIFGQGPIQGFATTLVIGILTSLFTSIFLARLVFEWRLDRNKPISFTGKQTENFLRDVKVDFIGMRKYFYIASAIVVGFGVISLTFRGLNTGVDFKGGRTYIVRFDQDVKTAQVQENLKKEFGEAPEVKTFGGDNQVKITTKFMIEDGSTTVDSLIEQKLFLALSPIYANKINLEQFSTSNKTIGIMSSQKVGPTVAYDIKVSAVYSIFFALLVIFFYIFIRFNNFRFGVGALASLLHDVLFVLGWFSLLYGVLPFSLEADQAFIAAILTIVGYSINDTVVVFDRVREYLHMGKRWDKKETYNRAMNSTLRRTLNTSFTTLLTILAMFIFGGEVIRGFMFALLIGIGTGTYSSIFVATSIVYDVDIAYEKKEAKKALANAPVKK